MPVLGGNAIEHGQAYAGMVTSLQLTNAVSKLNTGAASIAYGKGVVSDGEQGAVLPTATSTAGEFVGIVKYELNRARQDGETGAPVDRDMTVVTAGEVWVKVLDTVAKDDPVYLRVGATDTGDFSGIVGADATLGVLIPGAKFTSGGDAGDLVKVSLVIGG